MKTIKKKRILFPSFQPTCCCKNESENMQSVVVGIGRGRGLHWLSPLFQNRMLRLPPINLLSRSTAPHEWLSQLRRASLHTPALRKILQVHLRILTEGLGFQLWCLHVVNRWRNTSYRLSWYLVAGSNASASTKPKSDQVSAMRQSKKTYGTVKAGWWRITAPSLSQAA